MTSRHLLAIIAVIQGVTLALLVVLILFNRGVRDRRRAGVRPRRAAVDEAMRAWTLAGGPVGLGTVMTRLSRLPTNAAIDALVAWSARLPADGWQALAAKVTELRWAAAVRSWSTSRQWWRRLQAARLLSVAATAADEPLLVALLSDSHSAVYIAAAGAIERFDSPTLVRAALDRLPTLPTTVRAYYAALLRRVHAPVAAMLKDRLARTDDPALPVFAEFAGYFSPTPDGFLYADLEATIVGGTGRFAGATGSYTFSILFDPATFQSIATIEGTISHP